MSYEHLMGIGIDAPADMPVPVPADPVLSQAEIDANIQREYAASLVREERNRQENILKLSLANAGIAAIIAQGDDRMRAAVIGAIVTYLGFQTKVLPTISATLCPFRGQGGDAFCLLPMLPLVGIATGYGFRLKAKKEADES